MSRAPLALLVAALVFAAPAPGQDPATADTFEREALRVLKSSHEQKRSVSVHVGGQTIHGLVKAIGPDVVVLSNRERGTILVRRERIDAMEAD